MRRRAAAFVVAACVFAGSGVALALPASAQVPSPPEPAIPLPELPTVPIPPTPPIDFPEEVVPFLATASPVANEVCSVYGVAVVVALLFGPALGPPAGQLFPVLVAGMIACASLPAASTRTKCAADADFTAAYFEALDIVAGVVPEAGLLTLVTPPGPVGTAVDQIYAVEGLVIGQAGTDPGVGAALAQELDCVSTRR